MSDVEPQPAEPTDPSTSKPLIADGDLDVESEVEGIEIGLLLEGIERRYGFDFRDYAQASIQRRVQKCVEAEQLNTVSALQERLLRDPACMARFLDTALVNVSSFFRDPAFYRSFREELAPLLREEPHIRIWAAGCANGEEVYSLAIVLRELGLYDRTIIYATDLNATAVAKGRAGIYSLAEIRQCTRGYQAAGGINAFSDYYVANYDRAVFKADLKANVVWAVHNLTCDGSLNAFDVIVCRNVLIYFNRKLQAHVHRLLYDSLKLGGFLVLGERETLAFTPHEAEYSPFGDGNAMFRRVG